MPEELAVKFSAALQAPVFEIYLGRKCCVPSEIIYQGCFSDMEQVMEQLRELAGRKALSPAYRYREIPGSEYDEETLLLSDVPLRFGIHKLYGERYVKKESFSF
jgi:CRISPR system Cascade subunit CasD